MVYADRSLVTRRDFLHAGGAALVALHGFERLIPAYARTGLPSVARRRSGSPGRYELTIGRTAIDIGGRRTWADAINSTVPGPLLRFREGDTATIPVTNALDEDTSIHWHGIILPNGMDGVPKVTFPGIAPGETFVYEYPLRQSGTYWYHSHSGLQEQLGHYGPLIIDPAEPEPFAYDRDYVVMLGDWTFEDPHDVLAHLKKMGGYYNFRRRTVADLFRGDDGGLADRLRWGRMRMDATDIADVTGATYTYVMNGMAPQANWTGLFRPGERVRLRFINAAAASFFDVRIPGLALTVIQADGQNVQPVTVDEFRIAIAETYDVIVQPTDDMAYTIFAESMDRSGYARGTLAPRPGMSGPIPPRRTRPVRSMADMGMAMGGMDMGGGEGDMRMPGMQHGDHSAAPATEPVPHGPDNHGPGNQAVPEVTRSRLSEPGVGLGEDGRRVLLYTDLRSLAPGPDHREAVRELELHLTGHMERYLWSFDGKKFSQAPEPIPMRLGERIRVTFVNDTMMEHPIHLHGMWMELENGAGHLRPRKHTINVKPAERVSFLATPDVPGKWALHCHILYHMETGMFRVVEVIDAVTEDDA